MMRTETEVRGCLKRMLANGPLTALPKSPGDLDVFLALAASRFEARRPYSESAVNEILERWLATFCAPFGVDHVTVRRCLVDSHLLTRDKAGSAYEVAPDRLSQSIEDTARGLEPAAVMSELRNARESRKRRAQADGGTIGGER